MTRDLIAVYSDYFGAKQCGLGSLLIRRLGQEGEAEAKDDGEDLTGIEVVSDLQGVIEWIRRANNTSA